MKKIIGHYFINSKDYFLIKNETVFQNGLDGYEYYWELNNKRISNDEFSIGNSFESEEEACFHLLTLFEIEINKKRI